MNSEDVYRQLEKEIITGVLKPKERLIESELCKRLKISRTLLREVFRRLEGMGLVILTPNKGAIVRNFTAKEIEDVYLVRITLEKTAVPLIFKNIDFKSLQELKELNKEFEKACKEQDIEGMIFLNLAFHRRLSQISGNYFLCQLLEIARLHTHQVRYISWVQKKRIWESLRDHKEMIQALKKRDLKKFEKVTLKHQEAGKKDYKKIFINQSCIA